jgi:hypothetical protein
MPVTLTLRSTKGTPLSNTEMDVNLSNIKVAVEALETAVAALPETADVASLIADAVSIGSLRTTLDPVYVDLAGDTMSGSLVLSGPPTVDLHASTKKYVDDQDALRAPLISPALTGTPTAPTAAPGTNTTQIATTAFVTAGTATANAIGSFAVVALGGSLSTTIGAISSGATFHTFNIGGAPAPTGLPGSWRTVSYMGEVWNSNGGTFHQSYLVQRVS